MGRSNGGRYMNRSKLLGALLLFLLPIFLWVGVAHGQSFRSGNTTTVGASEVVDSSLYATGNTIDIAGEVKGDVFCAGQNITISGRVTGDVICAGQTVRVSGVVVGDVRVAGQTVAIGGTVMGNVSAAGQTVTFEGSSTVGGDASIGSSNAVVNGTVGRDLSVGGETVALTSKVGRNVKASSDNLTLGSNTEVAGELSYTGRSDAFVASGAKVGKTTHYQPQAEEDQGSSGRVFAFGFGFTVLVVLALLILSLALVMLFPAAVNDTVNLGLANPLKTFLIGLAASIVTPIVVVVLVVSVVGIPLGLFLGLVWLLVLALNGPLFSYFVGRLIWRSQRNAIVVMLVGVLVVLVAYLIPFVGVLTFLAMMWLGAGMTITKLFRSMPRPQYVLAPHAHPTRSRKK